MRAISLLGSAFWTCQLPFAYTSYSLCGAKREQKWLHVGAFYWHSAHQLSAHPRKQCIMVTRWSSPHAFILLCSIYCGGLWCKFGKKNKKTDIPTLEGEAVDLRKRDGAVKCCKIHKTSALLEGKLNFHYCDNWTQLKGRQRTNPAVASEGFGGKHRRLKKVGVCRELHA